MTTARQVAKNALVLSGGGAKGAYEIGVMKALAGGQSPASDFQPMNVDILTGTSVGAYNATFLASLGDAPLVDSVGLLEKIWREVIANSPWGCGNGVYRLRDAPLNALQPGCAVRPLDVLEQTAKDAAFWVRYWATRSTAFLTSDEALSARISESFNIASAFSPDPLYDLIEQTLDRGKLAHSNKCLVIAATNWLEGTLSLFRKEDLVGNVGMRAVAASAAIPGVFPPVEIDDVPFHDGGVLLNTPLSPAIAAGAEVIHVIYLDPRVVTVEPAKLPNTLDTAYRMFLITQAAQTGLDIDQARSILRELERHRDLGLLDAEMSGLAPGSVWKGVNSRVLKRISEGRPYRPLTIHRYRPTTELGGFEGLLDFRSEFVDELIEMGYEDTVRHDCSNAGCVLPRA